MSNFIGLDGRHKLAILAAAMAWYFSIMFSQTGFALSAPKTQWMGWALAGIVTTVELVFNSSTRKLSWTLIITGGLCYIYGIWTNVTGFWEYQYPSIAFDIENQATWLSVFVGAILEILPEPLFMWGIGSAYEGDLIGNIVGLWSGQLQAAKPVQSTQPGRVSQPQTQKESKMPESSQERSMPPQNNNRPIRRENYPTNANRPVPSEHRTVENADGQLHKVNLHPKPERYNPNPENEEV